MGFLTSYARDLGHTSFGPKIALIVNSKLGVDVLVG